MDAITIDLRKIQVDVVNWMKLGQNKGHYTVLVNVEFILRVLCAIEFVLICPKANRGPGLAIQLLATFTCLQTDVNDRQTILETTCDQHIAPPPVVFAF